jgi:hypothetical protein
MQPCSVWAVGCGVCVQSLHIVGIAASDHAVTCNVSFIL